MTALTRRMRSGLRRVGDWIGGRDVEVAREPPSPELLGARPTRRPPVDVFEGDEELLLVADVPGAAADTMHLHVGRDRLTLLGEVGDVPGGQPLLEEVDSADWHFAFTLEEDLAVDRAWAALRDGVLTVTIPKQTRDARRRIPVRRG